MKKTLFALGILASTPLLAGGYYECDCEYECDCCYECDAGPCIDDIAYTPQYYDLDCACGISISADFLYWYGKESNLPLVQKAKTVRADSAGALFVGLDADFLVPEKNEYLRGKWAPGGRVALGFTSACDGWDLNANWTYYKSKQSRSFSVPEFPTFIVIGQDVFPAGIPEPGDGALLNPWAYAGDQIGDFIGQPPDGPTLALWDHVKGKYSMRLNQIDLELGRKFWLSRCTTLRPFIAVRGAWTRIFFHATSKRFTEEIDPIPFFDFYSSSNRYKNNFWGVGLALGLQPSWHLSRCFSIYGTLDAALLWGDFQQKRSAQEVTNILSPQGLDKFIDLAFASKSSDYDMQPVLDLGLGLRYENTFCCNRFGFSLSAGWEHHIWFDHVTRTKLTGGIGAAGNLMPVLEKTAYSGFRDDESNLVFGGFVLRARFDF